MIGDPSQEEVLVDKPMTPQEIKDLFYEKLSNLRPDILCLQQEIVLYLGKLIATNPSLFLGILNIKIGYNMNFKMGFNIFNSKYKNIVFSWIVRAMEHLIQIHIAADKPVAVRQLENMSPSRIRKMVYRLLTFREENLDIE